MPPFDRDTRISKLQAVKTGTPVQTGIKISWQGETKPFDVYKIPIEILVYNKLNGRIGTLVATWEAQPQNQNLNIENPDHVEVIEKFLWDSKPTNFRD